MNGGGTGVVAVNKLLKTTSTSPISVHGAKHIKRLERRATNLDARIKAGIVRNLDDEKAELSSIRWVIKELAKQQGL
jgi:hypothetical protein